MNAIKKDVEALVIKELESANEQFPLFNSVHEAYAVILEETQEASEDLDNVDKMLSEFWRCVRVNEQMKFLEHYADNIKTAAISTAIEAIQIAAMAEKFRVSFVGSPVEAEKAKTS